MPAAQKPVDNPFLREVAKFIEDEVGRAVAPLHDQRSASLDRVERRLDHLFESRVPSAAITDLNLALKDGKIVVTATAASGDLITRSLVLPLQAPNPVGTWHPGKAYKRLDLVVRDGGSFIANKDKPGTCPGEGWQMCGQRGKPGRSGKPPTASELRHLIAEGSRDG